MNKAEKDRILKGMLEWYEGNPDAVYYEEYLLSEKIGKDEWDRALDSLTKEQFRQWDLIRNYYKYRLENLGITKEGSANFIRDKLKQEGLWKNTIEDKLEEHELELCLDEVSKLLQKPVKKLSDKDEDIIRKNTEDILGE